jgi:hypothetical protein
VYVVVFGVGDSSLPFDAGIEIMSPSITHPPVPRPQEEPVLAEEVAAPTDPSTLAKITVTQAIRNATMEDFDGNNFIINGKTYTFKTDGASVPALQSFCHKNGIQMDDGKSLQTAYKGQLKEAIKNKHRRINAIKEYPWTTKKGLKKKHGRWQSHTSQPHPPCQCHPQRSHEGSMFHSRCTIGERQLDHQYRWQQGWGQRLL